MNAPPEPQMLDFLLAQVSRLHHARVHQLLEAIGLYRGQPRVLHILWKQDGLTHKELAAIMQITPATITRMLQRMERAGFVQRRLDPSDQRVSRVYLTEAGWAVREQVEITWRRMECDDFAGFSPDELVTLRGFLQRIRTNLTRAIAANDQESSV
ncbi:MAG: MarR family winged helix-turn-helix transcriptional regulator [Chloroflexota bacterium]